MLTRGSKYSKAELYLELASVMFISLDPKGYVTMINRKGCEILGYEKEEIIGKNWFDNFLPKHNVKQVKDVFRKIIAGEMEQAEYYENSVLTKNGDERIITWHNAYIKDNKGKIINSISSGQDNTERKELEDQLKQSEKLEAIGRLAGGIAHDFNNQLSIIMGYSDLIREEVRTSSKLTAYANNILIGVKKATDLTTQLLAFARKGKYVTVELDIHDIINEVITLLKHSIDKRIRLVKQFEAGLSTTIGDVSQLKNAILNIALNSQDAMPDGGEIIFKTDCVDIKDENMPDNIADGKYIKISVIDTGKGMSKEIQKLIFEPFFTTKQRGIGTGMGLSATYGTIKNHKGIITVDSNINLGTEVKIYLPVYLQGNEKSDLGAESSSSEVNNKHILLVDDEVLVCRMTEEILNKLGFEVSVCQNGKDAVDFYEKRWKSIDLVILDLVMPEMNGKDAFINMKEINKDIIAVISSGYSIDGVAQEVLKLGAKGFIQKPFTKKELQDYLSNYI